MDEEKTEPQKQQVCSIRIAFPVTSDDDAIAYKKKIDNILANIPDANIQFSILSGRPSMPGT